MAEDTLHQNQEEKNKPVAKKFNWLLFLVSAGVLAAIVILLGYEEDYADISFKAKPPSFMEVSVVEIPRQSEKAKIYALAEINPRWQANISAAVSGRITKVHESAMAGERVKKGAPLLSIENTPFRAKVAAAKLAVKEAELEVWQAKNKTQVAKKIFARDNTTPPNDLAVHLPQLEIAKSRLIFAKLQMETAQKEVNDTKVVAPFAGFVTTRYANLGESVESGAQLLKLVDDAFFELPIEIGAADWKILDHPIEQKKAKIFNQQGVEIAEATVRRAGGFLDEASRQYKLFLDLKNPDNDKVLVGDFVKVELPGKFFENIYSIPASALTQEGYIWHVDNKNLLRRIQPNVIFRTDDSIIISASQDSDSLMVVKTPLAAFLPFQKIQPVIGKG